VKILFHAINGIGLGHINRTVTIARTIRELHPDTKCLFMTSTSFDNFFLENKFEFVKCPDIGNLNILNKEDNSKITDIIEDYDPDIVVYDTHPPRLVLTDERNKNRTNILILRRMNDNTLTNLLLSPASKYFSKIILPHTKEEFEHYGIDDQLMKRMKYSPEIIFGGQIIKGFDKSKIQHIKDKYNIAKDDYVILSISGGGGQYDGTTDTDDYFCECKSAFEKVNENIKNLKFIMVTGPLCKKTFNSSNEKLIIQKYEENLLELMHCSSLIISRAGYNSINEIMTAGVPSIILEIKCDHDNQKERAKYLESKGNSIYLEDITRLPSAILDTYKKNPQKKSAKVNIGNIPIAEEIIKLIQINKNIKTNQEYLPTNFFGEETLDGIYNKSISLFNNHSITNTIDSYEFNFKRLRNGELFFPESLISDIPIIKKNITRNEFFSILGFNKRILSYCIKHDFYILPQTLKGANRWFLDINDLANFLYFLYKKCDSVMSINGIYQKISKQYPGLGLEKVVVGFSVLSMLNIIESSKSITPNEVTISLTNNCNLKCAMCDIWKSERKIDMPLEKIKEIIIGYKKNRLKDIALTGGELFTRDDIFEIYSLIRQELSWAHISFSTNGYETDKINEFIKDINDQNISFTLSVDGIKKHDSQRGVLGAFNKTKESAMILKGKNIPVSIKFTITPVNYTEIYETYSLAKSLGLNFQLKPAMCDKSYTNKITDPKSRIFNFSEVMTKDIERQISLILSDDANKGIDKNFIKMIPDYLRKKKLNFSCECPKHSIFIMENGDTYSCLRSKKLGNIYEISYNEILQSKNAQETIIKKLNKCSACLSYYGSISSIEDKFPLGLNFENQKESDVMLISPRYAS
jgi:MoaA/NifB/PqqE/SkfB family radical SAM enzyme/predicted glycosyltransferase|tara:strand:- start:2171 stop:4765 length:2595 start_codon:yes stop_codon:yes gene_type:complete